MTIINDSIISLLPPPPCLLSFTAVILMINMLHRKTNFYFLTSFSFILPPPLPPPLPLQFFFYLFIHQFFLHFISSFYFHFLKFTFKETVLLFCLIVSLPFCHPLSFACPHSSSVFFILYFVYCSQRLLY